MQDASGSAIACIHLAANEQRRIVTKRMPSMQTPRFLRAVRCKGSSVRDQRWSGRGTAATIDTWTPANARDACSICAESPSSPRLMETR